MTLEQLNEAQRLRGLAEASRLLAKEFAGSEFTRIIFFPSSQTGVNPCELKLYGSNLAALKERPEVYAAVQSSIVLMRSALEAEAARHARAFDEYEALK